MRSRVYAIDVARDSITLSYDNLSALEKKLLLDLSGALEEAEPMSAADLVRRWATNRGIPEYEGEEVLTTLHERAFLDTRRATDGERLVIIQPLVRAFLRSIST